MKATSSRQFQRILMGCLTVHLPHEIKWNANLMQQGTVQMVPCNGTIHTVHMTYAAALKTPPIQKLSAENHMLQFNI